MARSGRNGCEVTDLGGQSSFKITRREARKVLGPALADIVVEHGVRINATSAILRRGFFGRLKWLLFGI